MLDFESDREKYWKYLVIERHKLQIQDILLQYFNSAMLRIRFILIWIRILGSVA